MTEGLLEKYKRRWICPKCGEKSAIQIILGYPGPELQEAAEAGHVVLAGCIPINDFDRHCTNCEHEWDSSLTHRLRKLRKSSGPGPIDAAEISFETLEGIHAAGFRGFRAVADLGDSALTEVPTEAGVYMVLHTSWHDPRFLELSPAGWLKGRDPSVTIEQLQENWVMHTPVLYIGKAGGIGLKSTLRTRLKAYLSHGAGRRASHWGGRFIWQLADSDQLLLAWRPTPSQEPRDLESELIRGFVATYGARPFANRTS